MQKLHLSAYSPLGSPDSASDMGNEDKRKPMDDPVVKEIAKKYNKSAGQVGYPVFLFAMLFALGGALESRILD